MEGERQAVFFPQGHRLPSVAGQGLDRSAGLGDLRSADEHGGARPAQGRGRDLVQRAEVLGVRVTSRESPSSPRLR